jgi:hypothetical protein
VVETGSTRERGDVMDGLTGATTYVAEIERMRSEIEGLRAQLDRTRLHLSMERDNAKRAMALISERMEAEAKEHDFCETFDEAVREINEALPPEFPKLTERVSKWKVTTTFSIEVEQIVEARSEDEARDEAESDFDPSTFDFSDVTFHEEYVTIEREGQS